MRQQIGDRSVVEPQADGVEHDEALEQVREAGGELGREHPAERMADDRRALDSESAQRLLVHQHEVRLTSSTSWIAFGSPVSVPGACGA